MAEPCLGTVTLQGSTAGGKADIVVWVDTSTSMDQEAAYVNENLNDLANHIVAAGVDARVVLVGWGVHGRFLCIKPPLGKFKYLGRGTISSCSNVGGTNTTNLPKFKHVQEYINSNAGLQVVLNTYEAYYPQVTANIQLNGKGQGYQPGWSWNDMVRPDAVLAFVAVTDDRAKFAPHTNRDGTITDSPTKQSQYPGTQVNGYGDGIAQYFIDQMQEIGRARGIAQPSPSLTLGFLFHSIVGWQPGKDVAPYVVERPALASASMCPHIQYSNPGSTYLELSMRSGGAIHQICDSDWSSIFADIADTTQHVASSVPCRHAIVFPGDGSVPANAMPAQVSYATSAAGQTVFQATHAAGNLCPSTATGSTFVVDSETLPRTVTLCAPACSMLKDAGVLSFRWDMCGPTPSPTAYSPTSSPTGAGSQPTSSPTGAGSQPISSPIGAGPPSPTWPPTTEPVGSSLTALGCHSAVECGCWQGAIILTVVLAVAIVALLLLLLVCWCCQKIVTDDVDEEQSAQETTRSSSSLKEKVS